MQESFDCGNERYGLVTNDYEPMDVQLYRGFCVHNKEKVLYPLPGYDFTSRKWKDNLRKALKLPVLEPQE